MKTRYTFFLYAVFFVCCLVVLGSCFSPWQGNEAEVTLHFTGGDQAGRAIDSWPPDSTDIANLAYEVTFKRGSASVAVTGKGSGPIKTTLTPGTWDIEVLAFMPNGKDVDLYAADTVKNAAIRSGQNNSVTVTMSPEQGDGSDDFPFLVYNVETLMKVGKGTDSWTPEEYYRQIRDIDMSAVANFTPIGTNGRPFIVGGNSGMAQYCTVNGTITGYTHVGGVVGYNEHQGTVESCYTTGSVKGKNWVGGVVGRNNSGNNGTAYVKNSYATGNVEGTTSVGGVAGKNDNSVQNCVALNKNITTTENKSGANTHRVIGNTSGGTMNNNYGRDNMELIYNDTSDYISGVYTNTDPYGEDVLPADCTNPSGFWDINSFWNSSGIWDSSIWNYPNSGILPTLQDMPGRVQNPTVTP